MSDKRTVVDNVIYANFGKVREVPQPEPKPNVTSDTRCFAARIFADYLAELTDSGRLSRGKTYARKGKVVELSFAKGRIVGSVAGSQNEPFEVALVLPRRNADDLSQILSDIAAIPQARKLVKQGQLPEPLVRRLVAESANDLMVRCDCPDFSYVCKHAVAVAEIAGEFIEAEPERLFALRAISMEQLEAVMRHNATVEAAKSTTDPSVFWEGRPLPELPNPEVKPAIDDSNLDDLRRVLRCISYTSVEELRGVADIEDMYDFLTRT
ncbi:MAG: SWIM zinc finger family protein [Corynebacterium sp.]|nr:SWIM zinc finger family protein [Corynebacterium sp.]